MKTPNVKMAVLGFGILAAAGILVSFTLNDGDKDKMKRYQVIHHSNGLVQEFDTIIPMESNYTVEQFLADKGIKSENVEIIRMSAMGEHALFIEDKEIGEGEKVRVHQFRISNDLELEGAERKEVRITKEIGPDGTQVTKKYVDGKEVELTAEELEDLEMGQNGEEHTMMIRIHEDGEKGEPRKWEGKEEKVEIKCEVDAEGKVRAQKWVNGVEVPLTEEEMLQFSTPEGEGKNVIIHMESLEKGAPLEKMEIEIEQLMKELSVDDEGKEERKMVIVKEIEDGEGKRVEEHVFQIDGNEELEWTQDKSVNVEIMGESDEDFTLVIVTENCDEKSERNMNFDRQVSQNEVAVFPNPSSGLVTIRFEQSEKVKTTISIADMSGKVVFKESLGKFSGTYLKEIDLQKFGVGTYLISIQQGNDVHTEKIVVE